MDECCCDVETVDSLNRHHILPIMSQLVNKNFFRFFSVCLNCKLYHDNYANKQRKAMYSSICIYSLYIDTVYRDWKLLNYDVHLCYA